MRYFHWKVEYFEDVWNPDNCETWVMERDERGGFRVSHFPNAHFLLPIFSHFLISCHEANRFFFLSCKNDGTQQEDLCLLAPIATAMLTQFKGYVLGPR